MAVRIDGIADAHGGIVRHSRFRHRVGVNRQQQRTVLGEGIHHRDLGGVRIGDLERRFHGIVAISAQREGGIAMGDRAGGAGRVDVQPAIALGRGELQCSGRGLHEGLYRGQIVGMHPIDLLLRGECEEGRESVGTGAASELEGRTGREAVAAVGLDSGTVGPGRIEQKPALETSAHHIEVGGLFGFRRERFDGSAQRGVVDARGVGD